MYNVFHGCARTAVSSCCPWPRVVYPLYKMLRAVHRVSILSRESPGYNNMRPGRLLHCTHTHTHTRSHGGKHGMFVGGAVCTVHRCVRIGSPRATGEPTPFCLHVLDYTVFSSTPPPSLAAPSRFCHSSGSLPTPLSPCLCNFFTYLYYSPSPPHTPGAITASRLSEKP